MCPQIRKHVLHLLVKPLRCLRSLSRVVATSTSSSAAAIAAPRAFATAIRPRSDCGRWCRKRQQQQKQKQQHKHHPTRRGPTFRFHINVDDPRGILEYNRSSEGHDKGFNLIWHALRQGGRCRPNKSHNLAAAERGDNNITFLGGRGGGTGLLQHLLTRQ